MVGEEAELAVGFVANDVGVFARPQDYIRTAHIYADTVAERFEMIGLRMPIPKHFFEMKPHQIAIAQPVAIPRGKITVDSVPNVIALGPHTDGLAHHHRRIGVHRDIAVVRENPLVCARGERGETAPNQQCCQENSDDEEVSWHYRLLELSTISLRDPPAALPAR